MSFTAVVAICFVAGIGVMVFAIFRAPGGYEDKDGFHKERRD